MKRCFVITPIGNEGSEIRKRADQVFKYIILPVCEKTGFNAIRVDQLNQSDTITQTIIDHLNSDELVIADMTGNNPNAFYEMGFRAKTEKPMIHIKQKGDSIPFDIAGIRAFDYDLQDLDAVEEVKNRLEQTVNSFGIEENTSELEVSSDNSGIITKDFGVNAIFPILYDIQDNLSNLRKEIRNKDNETIQAAIRASIQPTSIEDPSVSLMKVLLPEIIKNPDAFKTIMELSEKAKGTSD